jgi:hypothetical protein
MDDPEQALTEAEVPLGLRTQPGHDLRDHEDIRIPKISFNEYLNINMEARRVLGGGWEGQIGTILGHGEGVQALHQARQEEIIDHGISPWRHSAEQEPMILREDIRLGELRLHGGLSG